MSGTKKINKNGSIDIQCWAIQEKWKDSFGKQYLEKKNQCLFYFAKMKNGQANISITHNISNVFSSSQK